MTTVCPAPAHGLSQLHVCFVCFLSGLVRDYRIEPKCCQVLLFIAAQIHAAGRQPLKGLPLICVHTNHSLGLDPCHSRAAKAVWCTTCCTALQKKMQDWEYRNAGMYWTDPERKMRQIHCWFPTHCLGSLAKELQRKEKLLLSTFSHCSCPSIIAFVDDKHYNIQHKCH